jgi:hypothetical protein
LLVAPLDRAGRDAFTGSWGALAFFVVSDVSATGVLYFLYFLLAG